MKKYQSLDSIKSATIEDLAATESMNEKSAESVYTFFHKADPKVSDPETE